MADVSPARFPCLGNANYPEWGLRMEAVLVKKGLWGVVEVLVSKTKSDGLEKTADEMKKERDGLIAKRNVAKMAEARAELILRVEDGQLAHMTARDPMEIWENLQRVHRATGFATSLALRRRFLTAKKADDEMMEAWIGRIQTLVLRMEHAGIEVTAQDQILALTMGLPSSYDAVIINFDATSPEQLTVNHVITRLLNEETRQISSPGSSPNATVSDNAIDEALAAIAARRDPADVTCFFCDKKGHFKSDCPEKVAWQSSKHKRKAGTAALAIGLDSDWEESDAF
ncbi:CCHC-type domain-containing protein [Mycena venus]|uniref:CCHC-type domain-containing protein n=1 Tax=Mycena venus TaxID=2733690 RepID=A0A8H6X462_9AGAR|nr:CCHC-type domain-containing protein [Mycena venus]